MVRVTVVIPVHNEEEIIASTTEAVIAGFQRMSGAVLTEVILCENGSSDGTRALGARLATMHGEVSLLALPKADYGAAMREGFLAASGDFIVNFDADYYDFAFVEEALIVDADIVVAAKNIDGSRDTRALVRRLGSRGFGWLVRRMLGITTTETHGIKLYRRQSIQKSLARVTSTRDLFDTELVARAETSGLTVVELPITTREMRHSRSGILRRMPRTVLGLLRLRRSLRAESAKLGTDLASTTDKSTGR